MVRRRRIERSIRTSQECSRRSWAWIRGIPERRSSHDRAFRSSLEDSFLPMSTFQVSHHVHLDCDSSRRAYSIDLSTTCVLHRQVWISPSSPPPRIHPRRSRRRPFATIRGARLRPSASLQIARSTTHRPPRSVSIPMALARWPVLDVPPSLGSVSCPPLPPRPPPPRVLKKTKTGRS